MKNFFKQHSIFLFCLFAVILISTFRLTETPPTWMDEGIFSQVARNMALHGVHGMQVAPGVFENGTYITTSYTVTGPIAISYLLFGFGLFQARMVMALFIIVLYITFYLLIRRRLSGWSLIFTLLLVAFFAPLYGHGKNVMGEVPGLTYLFLSFLFLMRIYEGKKRLIEYGLFGLFVGFAVVTKPIYVLIIPALLITLWLYRYNLFIINKSVWVFMASVVCPIFLWILLQFEGVSLSSIISFYSNPNDIDMVKYVKTNIQRFFTELQPLYTLGLFVVWTWTIVRRAKKGYFREVFDPIEVCAWILTVLLLLTYIRTVGYYRYFFAAELLALVFVVPGLLSVISGRYKKYIFVVLLLLVMFHVYQTTFNSWISSHMHSNRSSELSHHVGSVAEDDILFFYQVPEAVNFLPQNNINYYQYVKINTALENGKDQLVRLYTGEIDTVITNRELINIPILSKYRVKESFDRYVIMMSNY